MTGHRAPGRPLPDFIIGGAARCGTTSLYTHLEKHPDICMSSVKEPQYFSGRGPWRSGRRIGEKRIGTPEWYASLFSGCSEDALKGEATVAYLWRPQSAELIKETVPDVRLIFMLRDPVARIHSQYLYDLRSEKLPPLHQLVREEDSRIDFYVHVSRYAEHLQRFRDTFDASQILVLLLDELHTEPLRIVQRVFAFLGVDDSFVPDGLDVAHNRAVASRSRWFDRNFRGLVVPFPRLHRAWRPLTRAISRVIRRPVTAPVADELRGRLVPRLIDDIERLEVMLGRPLDAWKTV